jgi:hypothetical protein
VCSTDQHTKKERNMKKEKKEENITKLLGHEIVKRSMLIILVRQITKQIMDSIDTK